MQKTQFVPSMTSSTAMKQDKIEGRNPVTEAIKSGREIDKLLVSAREGSIKKIVAMAKEHGIVVQEVVKTKLDELSETGAHQGVIALIAAHDYATVEDILARAEQKGEKPFIILLDEITDPHNLGSILRTANATGAHGVIIPKRRSVGLSSVVAKTSAGALEYTPVARVSNLAQTIDKLKEQGIWFYATHQDATEVYTEVDLKGGIGIVIGSEGNGVSRIVAEKCDFLISIPMKGEINSLNASVAAGVIMYEALRQRG